MSDGLEETFFCLAQRGEYERRRAEQGRAAATWGMRCDAMRGDARRECNATWLDASQTAAHNNGDEAAKGEEKEDTPGYLTKNALCTYFTSPPPPL